MASGRMIQRKISRNKKLPTLIDMLDQSMGVPHGSMAALLYTWSIAHLDREGRMHGDPLVVKGEVVPRITFITPELVDVYLRAMAHVGLVQYYEANGDRWLEFPAFEDSQPGMRKGREPESIIPSPAEGRQITGIVPADCRQLSGKVPPQSEDQDQEKEKPDSAAPNAGPPLVLIPTEPEPFKPDLEAVYAAYPRKEGRKKGLERLEKIVTTREVYARVMKALANYCRKVEVEDPNREFVKMFDSWTSVWEDYENYVPRSRGQPQAPVTSGAPNRPPVYVPKSQRGPNG
jgi:hypothetical protein